MGSGRELSDADVFGRPAELTDDQVFGQPETAAAAPSTTGDILEPTTKALLRGTAQATVGLPGAFIESAGLERLYGGKYQPGPEPDSHYRQKAVNVLRSEQLAIGLGPNEIQAPSEAEIAQEAERQKVMDTFWNDVNRRLDDASKRLDKAAPRDAILKDTLATLAVPLGRKMQDVSQAATTSELLRDPYRETTPIGERLREKTVQTVLTEGLEQLPNFAVSAGVGAATRGALGAGKLATFGGAGAASYVLEKGDIFNEGAEILAKQYGGRDSVPPEAWDKLNYFAANHGAFNAMLDAIAPSSQVNRAVLAKAGIERVMSKAGLKYVGKEFLKDFLLKELPQELVQEVGTIRAVEKGTGKQFSDEEILARLTQVGVGTLLPVGAGSVSASVANVRNAQPPATAGEQEAPPTAPPSQDVPETPAPPAAAPSVSGVAGAPRRVWTAKGTPVDTNLMVVDADQLTTSHDESGNINPAFPADLQPRDRSRIASQAQIAGMAQALNPELLGDTGQSSSGAPIVGPDGAVESGNARTLAIRQAYDAGRGDNYRQWLTQNAGRFGIDPDQISGIGKPVLVRMRTTPLDTAGRVAFTQESNQADIAPMAPAELEGQPLFEPTPGDQIPITGTSTVALDTQRQAKGEGQDQLDLFTAPGERPVSNQQLRRIANETPKVGLVQAGTFRTALTKINTPSEAAHVVASIRKEAQENIIAVATDADGNIVGILRHGIGGPASVGSYPAILLGALHSMPKASKVWFAHNHPSGQIMQSTADRNLTDSLGKAMQDTGLEMMGMLVVVPNNKSASFYPEGISGRTAVVPVQPGRRTQALPVTERKFVKVRQGDRDSISNEAVAKTQITEIMGEDSGILLTDTQLRPLGYVPMSVADMQKLRTGESATGAGALLRAMHEANATGAFVRINEPQEYARQAALNMKGLFAANSAVTLHDTFIGDQRTELNESPSTFYVNPIGPMYGSIRNAVTKLADAIGRKEYGTKIVQREEALDPGLLTPLLSPSTVANNYPSLARYLEHGQKATNIQERLRNAFGKRMHAVETALGAVPLRPNWSNPTFKANKTALWNVMMAEDAMGATMSLDELKAAGANEQVINAHRLIRAAYDHALGIANRARAERGKDPIHRREGYVPHFFHSYFLVVDGNIAGSARTLREAIRMTNPLAREGRKIRIVPKQFQFPGEAVQAAVLGDGDYFRMLGKIQQDFSFTADEAQQFLDGLVRRRGRSRFVGNFLQRKGVEGWEHNLDWAHRHYFNMISRYAALDHFKSKAISAFEQEFGAFDKDHKGIARYIKNYINDVNGNPTAAEELINASLAKVPALGKWLGAYFGDRPALQLASGFTNGVAIAKLGLYNLSAALVNGVQMINTQTLIGPRWTAAGMRRWARVEAHLVARRVGFETSAVRDIGLLKQMGVDVAMGLASGAGYSNAGPGNLFRKSTAFFQGVERFNRATAGLGAYYKARSDGRNHDQAIAYGRDVVDRTQFDYSIADTPSFIRRSGPIGQLLFQFKKFPIKQLEFMVSLRGAEKARFWIPFFTLAGYYAIPGIELLKNLLRDLFDWDMELELKKFLMEWAGEDPERQAIATQILRGAFGHAGLDITKRIGAGDFVPSELKDLAGPGVSSAVRAVQMASREEWIETLRAISTAPGNLVKAIANDGELTDPMNRERSVLRLTPAERVMSSVGFQPERVSLESDTSRIIRYETQKVTRARKEIIDAIIDAAKIAEDGDPEKAERKIARILDRAEKMQIGFTAEQMENEITQKNLTRAQRAWINASPEIKARTAGVMEFHESRQPVEP